MIYDKRKLKRHDIFLIVEFKPAKSPGGFSIGITRDLSLDGFSLEAQTIECQRGDIMEFRLKHPDADWSVDIAGEVIWRNHSWYKYIIGIKFLGVTEEQNAKIHQLMSAVRDADSKQNQTDKNTEILPVPGKEKMPEATLTSGSTDYLIPDKRIITGNITLKSADHCELTDTERTFIAGDVFSSGSDNGKEDIHAQEDNYASEMRFKETLLSDIAVKPGPAQASVENKAIEETARSVEIEEAAPTHEKSYAANFGKGNGGVSARATNIHDTIENSRKKKLWLYVPLAMVVIIVFVIALPVMIKKFNHAPTDYVQAPAESTVNNSIEKDKSVSSSYNAQKNGKDLNIPSAPVQQTGTKDSVFAKNDKAFNLREASTGKDSTGILPTKSIAETEKSKKGDNAAPLASMEKTIKNPSQANNADILKPELSAVAKAEPGKVESQNKIDLIAKIDEAFKDLRAIQNEKPVKADADIKTEKTPEVKPLAKTEEQPVKLQVAKLEDTPAAAAITESQSIPVVKQEVNTLEEKKSSITSTGQSVRRQEMPNVALLVKRFNPRTGPNVSPSTPGVTTSDLLKKWKHIGSTNSGVPLFISPDNISYPYEHVVNLLVKASVNKKDFVDLLAINCSQIKLRILEERNGNNPAFSSYSAEWKDIIPDSMILYKSACPEKK